jgi:hypothetical protein
MSSDRYEDNTLQTLFVTTSTLVMDGCNGISVSPVLRRGQINDTL